MDENNKVKFDIIENVGIIKGANLPVNALSYAVRTGLLNALENYKDSKSFYKTLTKRFKRTPVKVTFKSVNGD